MMLIQEKFKKTEFNSVFLLFKDEKYVTMDISLALSPFCIGSWMTPERLPLIFPPPPAKDRATQLEREYRRAMCLVGIFKALRKLAETDD